MIRTLHWTSMTIVIGICVCAVVFIIPKTVSLPLLQTVEAVPFPEGIVTRDMAHLRIPYSGIAIGKSLILATAYETEETDVQVGIRQGEFWLDYKRIPLEPTVAFPLTNSYRHPDGSFDVMYFLPGDSPMDIAPVEARIVPSAPEPRALLRILRSRAKDSIIRNAP